MSGDLHVYVHGPADAPPLLLLHGLTEAGSTWPDAIRRWAPHSRVYAPDLRGHGHSPRFTTTQLTDTWTTFVDDVSHLIHTIGHGQPITVVGHSLGGRIGAVIARDAPNLVARLVLEDPPLTPWSKVPPDVRDAQGSFLAGFTTHTVQARMLEAARTTNWTTEEIQAWAQCKPLVDLSLIAHLDLGEIDPIETLNGLRVPTLLLTPGGNPHIPTPAEVTNPHIGYELVPEAGHCIRRDAPNHYHRIVDPFLRGT